jgi:hypothetical protein
MSADHSLDRQPGVERLADDIRRLKQEISELRTLQLQGNSALNLQLSATATASQTVANGAVGVFYYHLINDQNKRLFGFATMSMYQGSVAAANEIGAGNAAIDAGYDVCFNPSNWGVTDNNDLWAVAWVRNKTGSPQTILFRGNWRYLVSSATTA